MGKPNLVRRCVNVVGDLQHNRKISVAAERTRVQQGSSFFGMLRLASACCQGEVADRNRHSLIRINLFGRSF